MIGKRVFLETGKAVSHMIKIAKFAFFFLITFIFFACKTKEPVVVVEPEPDLDKPVSIVPEIPVEKEPFVLDMILIKGGTFTMGSPRNSVMAKNEERPAHSVTLGDFYLGVYEINQGQYYEITGLQPSKVLTSSENKTPQGWMTLPVDTVSWYDALVFCNKLSIQEDFNPVYKIDDSTDPNDWGDVPRNKISKTWDSVEIVAGANGFRLPTEAEWEYAARGGAGTPNDNLTMWFKNKPEIQRYYEKIAWIHSNSDNKSHEVGSMPPNELGLYDIAGNAMEWCWDWYALYKADPLENPKGPPTGDERIIRGGAWSYDTEYCRPTYRHKLEPWKQLVNLGFRVARSQ